MNGGTVHNSRLDDRHDTTRDTTLANFYFLACIATVDIDTHTPFNVSLDLFRTNSSHSLRQFLSSQPRLMSVNHGLAV